MFFNLPVTTTGRPVGWCDKESDHAGMRSMNKRERYDAVRRGLSAVAVLATTTWLIPNGDASPTRPVSARVQQLELTGCLLLSRRVDVYALHMGVQQDLRDRPC